MMDETTLNTGNGFVLLCPGFGSSMTSRAAYDACLAHARSRSLRGITYELSELSGGGMTIGGEYVAICGNFRDSIEVLPSPVIQACEFGIDDLRGPVRRREYVRRLLKVHESATV
jgi:hypothetical protein